MEIFVTFYTIIALLSIATSKNKDTIRKEIESKTKEELIRERYIANIIGVTFSIIAFFWGMYLLLM